MISCSRQQSGAQPAPASAWEQVWGIVEKEQVNAVSIVGDAMAVPLLDPWKHIRGAGTECAVQRRFGWRGVFGGETGPLPRTPAQHLRHNSFGSSESGATGR